MWLVLLSLLVSSSFSKVNLPTNLTSTDRNKALEVLGHGTSTKLLTDPYPLGGYAGFEVGLSVESIAIDEIAHLGATTEEQDQFTYPIISIGKGLFNNFDSFLNFMPFNEGTGLSVYGALLRYGFYQTKYFPANFSAVVHMNTCNINNQIINQSVGYDLVAGINVRNFSVYLGAGQLRSRGEFIGGPGGIVAIENGSQSNKINIISTFHSVLGGTVHFDEFFIAAQVDQYAQPTFSVKLGYRN